jgi:hypothetical protein
MTQRSKILCLAMFVATLLLPARAPAQLVYATVPGKNWVVVVDSATNSVFDTISIATLTATGPGTSPGSIAITPDAKLAYVVNQGCDLSGSTVSVIDTNQDSNQDSVVATIPIPGCPREIALSPDGLHGYVTTVLPSGVGAVIILDLSTNSVTTVNLTSSDNPTGIAVSPTGDFVRFGKSDGIYALATATNTVTSAVIGDPQFPGSNCQVGEIVGTPDGNFLLVTCSPNEAVLLDAHTGRAIFGDSVSCTIGAPAITPDGTKAFVPDAECGGILDIPLATGVGKLFYLPGSSSPTSRRITFTSDGTKAFASGFYNCCSQRGQADVEVFNPANDTSIADVIVSFAPTSGTVGIAALPNNNTFPPPNQAPVMPLDRLTNTSPVTVTFTTVSQAGYTSLFLSSSGPAVPSGFALGSPAVYYDLATTAQFTGNITICITSPEVSSTSQLFHFESSGPVDITTSVNPPTICGTTASLSPFAILQPSVTTSTTTVTASVNPSVFGQQVSFTATVAPTGASANIPTGTVTFNDGATNLRGGTSLGNGVWVFNTTTTLSVGTHLITASYSGDNNFSASTSTGLTQTVNQAASMTGLVASPNPSTFGQAVTLTATVSPVAPGAGTPSTTVAFLDSGVSLGTGPLNGGQAMLTIPVLTVGMHSFTAVYPGDDNFLGSTSAALAEAVNKATPSISWAPPAPIVFGTPLSAQLNAIASVPGTLFIYSPAAGTVLNAGTQMLLVTFTPTDTTDYTTASASVTLTVSQAAPVLLWAPPAPITFGTPLSGAQLNATANVAGTFAYSLGLGTLLNVGPQTLTVLFIPADAVDYTTAAASVVLLVTPAITSGNSTTFTEGAPGSFTVMASGTPTPALTVSGTLPNGVTFTDNGNGTGTLSGTPAVGTSGTYALTFTASSNGSSVSQSFTLTVNSGAAITSGSMATFTEQVAGFFLVTTTGLPAPSLIETGPLPKGVTFTDNGNGTATLSGTPAAGTSGTYPVKIVANNGVGTGAGQAFTLTVNTGAAITSGSSTTFTVGSASWFTLTASGSPTPALAEAGNLPSGVTFVDNNDGTGTLAGTPAAGSAGTYPLVFTAVNGVNKPAMQSFTLTVNQGPAITSGSATTFTVGAAGAFLVTTTGFPVPSLKEMGALPSGVTFVDNGDGTALLSGTPAAGSGRSYPLTITAANGVDTNAVQTFILTVDQSLAITSGSMTTFTEGTQGWFSITTTGFPVPTLSETGTLPVGVTLTDNGNGTATLAGIPAAGTGGNYGLTIRASNGGQTPDVTQSFTLTVNQGPAILTGNNTTFTVGVAGSFTVMTSGFPIPAITQTGTLPSGLTFVDNGDGTATLSGTPLAGTGGSYPLTLTAGNGVDTPAMQTFTLVINQGPAITSSNVVTFNELVLGSFVVTATGNPVPALSEVGNLPNGVIFVDNGDGTATLAGIPAAGSGGQYGFTIAASNGVLPNATQTFTLTVVSALTFTSPRFAYFTVGTQSLFTITTAGTPVPSLARSGALPAGITFTALGNGTATLSGTPQPGTEGSYPITLTAGNGTGATATQAFNLIVLPSAHESAPLITSANHATFAFGLLAGNGTTHPYNFFKVTTTGFPVPKLTAKFVTGGIGTVPYFHDNGDGTATISFTLFSKATERFTITATGAGGLTATQLFTLSVVGLPSAPKFTSPNQVGFTVGVPNSFTVAAGPFVDQITATGLPSGITLIDHHDGTATLSSSPFANGNATIKFTADNQNLNTAFRTKYTATQTFTLVFLP